MIIGAETNLVSVLVTTSVVAGHKWAESLMLMSEFMERGLVRTEICTFAYPVQLT